MNGVVEREALVIRLELNSSPFVLVGLFCFVQANISSGGWLKTLGMYLPLGVDL
jgi:hypothetical protein